MNSSDRDSEISNQPKEPGPKTPKRVVIVGAGIAGIGAANSLQAAGFEVTILESQNYVGGRICSEVHGDVCFNLGANWIHGAHGNPFMEIMSETGTKVYPIDSILYKMYEKGGAEVDSEAFDKACEELDVICDTILETKPEDKSFADYFNRHHPEKMDKSNKVWKMVLDNKITDMQDDPNTLHPYLFLEEKHYEGPDFLVVNGFNTITDHMSKDIKDIRLSHIVSSIDYSGGKVLIKHNHGEIEADHVIVTVSLWVLQQRKIEFIPALPEHKLDAIDSLGFSCMNKFLLVWDGEPFWDNVEEIYYSSELNNKFNFFVNLQICDPKMNALMTFAYSEEARKTESQSDEDLITEIMTILKDIYGQKVREPSLFKRTKWASNEYVGGSYSFPSTKTKREHYGYLTEEVNSKVFFAGEHTTADYMGYAHGSHFTGCREADKIISLNQ
ncbi:MAG: FAD-dependent oxidoreductase [Runella slithyformis]|nr:MAG: FAD-dependent oxidoreductase [Runella slithyformis]